MQVLIFDIKGKFAHFRKYYTNSSSLTYSIPPRTTIAGMVAAILGLARDSYYTLLNKENMHVAVKKMGRNKKLMQTVNYMKVTSTKELLNPKMHTQIPFEMITDEERVKFRIYFSCSDEGMMKELKERVKEKRYYYAPYLGAAPFQCSIDYIHTVDAIEGNKENTMNIHTAVNSKFIIANSIEVSERELILMREKMPSEFLEGRVIKEVDSYIFEDRGNPIPMKLNTSVYAVAYHDNGELIKENIVFL